MKCSRLFLLVPIVLIVLIVVMRDRGVSAPVKTEAPAPSKPIDVEVIFIDGTMKLKLMDDKIEMDTGYGILKIPTKDIRSIDCATRVPADTEVRLSMLIPDLKHPEYRVREKATKDLMALGERAYGPMLKARDADDAETRRRAEEIVAYLKNNCPAEHLVHREHDVVRVGASVISGKLTAATFKVESPYFGQLILKLTDARSIRMIDKVGEVGTVSPAPMNLAEYAQQFGKELVFKVTGSTQGSVWGSDTYTVDSNVAAAAVHAGVVQNGQTAVVRIRIVASPIQFVGSIRNNVTSSAYGLYPMGSYLFIPTQ